MKDHRYKLATLVLSTGLLLGACGGGGGEEEAQAPEEPEETAETAVEDEDTGQTDQSTETSDDSSTESDTSDDSSGGTTDDTEDTSDTTDDTSSDNTDTAGEEDTSTSDESSDTESSDTSTDSSSDSTSSDSESTDATGVAVLDQLGSTPDEAVSAAQENFDGDLTGLDLDQDRGDWVYTVSMQNDTEEYEVDLLAEDLSVMNEETENNDDNDSNEVFAYEDAIPHEEAVQTAMDEVGGELEGWSLDMDDGQLQYEVELTNTDSGNDADVTINAETGEVMETDN